MVKGDCSDGAIMKLIGVMVRFAIQPEQFPEGGMDVSIPGVAGVTGVPDEAT